jgi:hypothetical protein
VKRGEAGAFVASGKTWPGGQLPMAFTTTQTKLITSP